MFSHPRPHKSTTPISPAGIVDYMNLRQCFKLFLGSNTTNTSTPPPNHGVCHPADNNPPANRLTDLLAREGTAASAHPLALPCDRFQNMPLNANKTRVYRDPPFRKGKHKAKHPNSKSPHCRVQQLYAKRATARKRVLDRRDRRMAQARDGLSNLRKEAESLIEPKNMTKEDEIFLNQLANLHVTQKMQHDLERHRQQLWRAGEESIDRDAKADRTGMRHEDEALEEQERFEKLAQAKHMERKAFHQRREEEALRADAARQHVHEAEERKLREEQEHLFREEQARNAKEERRKQEEENRLREERERRLREENDRRNKEAQARERFLREERDRLYREEQQRRARAEQERLAKEEWECHLAERAGWVALHDQINRCFVSYEGKWNELRNSNFQGPVEVREMPWPVFGDVSSADQMTKDEIGNFIFHPSRPGVEGKTRRDKVKTEVLCFHPDKFNTWIAPKIQLSQRSVAQEIAGAVVRILTEILTEEEKQK